MGRKGSRQRPIVFSELLSVPKPALYDSDHMLLTGILQYGRGGMGKTACGK